MDKKTARAAPSGGPAGQHSAGARPPDARPSGQRQKHVPLRTCVVCRKVRGKRELVRVVRTPDGNVKVDSTGKLAGRGAYLCRAQACWSPALKGNRLSAALKAPVGSEDMAVLNAFAATLPETLDDGSVQRES